MTSSEDLGNQLEKLTESSQQLGHETEMLTRRMSAARSALEMIANGNSGPDDLRIAREALASLDDLNALVEAPEAFTSFVEASKAQMPPAKVEELKRFRELIESLSEELAPPVDSGPAK